MTTGGDGRETVYTDGSVTPERWQRIQDVCVEALRLDSGKRGAYLDAACAGDDSLRQDVDSLLRHRSGAEQFLHAPAVANLGSDASVGAPTPMPDRIGSYRVITRLGAGGMGEVFLAEDARLHRNVAIKRVLPAVVADPHAARRLLTEARAAAQLDHPHICSIFEVGEDAGMPFIVMPVVEGETLEARLRAGPLAIMDAVDLAAQIADALGAAHARGILHRDIKPANLIINTRGQVRVMDFGLARFAHDAMEASADTMSRLTATGMTIGTAAYMSPEQARGERVDARSDIFSLGVVMYEMLTGRRPFGGKSFAEIVSSTLGDEPQPITRQRP